VLPIKGGTSFLFLLNMAIDSFAENILGVADLIQNPINKSGGVSDLGEGIDGNLEDYLELPMQDDELLDLRKQWLNKSATYYPEIETRQKRNKAYYLGRQQMGNTQRPIPVSSNLIFQSQETFIPQALAKNPEPVVFSDNTDEGKKESNDIKTMLQFHADILCLRRKLGVVVRHWSIYFMGVMKHGWDARNNDITTEVRKPQNFILDPDGYIDEYGNYCGAYLGERIESTAKDLIALYPKSKEYITVKVNGKLGTTVTRTEWWTDKYCFTTFEEEVLDKHKNEFFKYPTKELDEFGVVQEVEGVNHFSSPKMPYTFLSVFSLQEHPYDDTNLIEQSIPSQDRISERDYQIDKNLRVSNNSLVVSDKSFNIETAKQAASGMEDGDPILAQGEIAGSIQRFPASPLPNGLLQSLENDKETLMGIFGVNGLVSEPQNTQATARGQILDQQHDSTRIGGGVGDALEQVADNVFNWWLQLYYVFYDQDHYASILGSGSAVEYVSLNMSNHNRRFVVSVSPGSMKPKDEVTEMNQAMSLWEAGAIDPYNFYKMLNLADPQKMTESFLMYSMNPQGYAAQFAPEAMTPIVQPGMPAPQPGQVQGSVPMDTDEPLSAEPANASLSQVSLSTPAMPQ
jgi:hypothetical protein